MVDLKLDIDEGMLLQTANVWKYRGDDEIELYEFYLTNKNLISVYDKSTKLFSKEEIVTEKISLSSIKIVNEKVQVAKVNNADWGIGMQILLTNGIREHYIFANTKKELQVWIDAIIDAITMKSTPINDNEEAKIEINQQEVNSTLNAKITPIKDKSNNDPSSDETKLNKKYIYCCSCGEKLNANSKFCNVCGTPTGNSEKPLKDEHHAEEPIGSSKDDTNNERKIQYEGKIYKCPSCGEVITSFTAICPACGHELNSKKVSATLKNFIDQINASEILIANSTNGGRSGWSSWSRRKKRWWIFLNIILVFIPLMIYLAIPLIAIKITPRLSKEEKQLASLVENFPFPNERESILEAIIFAKEKIDFISKETLDRKTAYWLRLWCSKAEQLKQKADLLFPNDPIVKSSYKEIQDDENRANRILKFKAIAGGVLFIAAVIFFLVRNGTIDTTDYNVELEWQTNGLFSYLPEPTITTGKIIRESEKQIQFELYKVSEEDFEDYVSACREAGFTVDVTKNDSVFYADNEAGYDLNLFYYPDKKTLKVSLDSYNLKDVDNNSNNDTKETVSEQVSKISFAEGTYVDITVKKIVLSVPNYWKEEGSKNEYLQFYAEKGNSVAMLSIAYPEESDDDYEVTFDGLYEDNDNMLKAVEAMFTDGDIVSYEEFETDYDIKGMLYRFTYNQEISWLDSVDGNGYCFCFPSEIDRRWFYVVLLQTNNIEGDKYEDDYKKILTSIRLVEDK